MALNMCFLTRTFHKYPLNAHPEEGSRCEQNGHGPCCQKLWAGRGRGGSFCHPTNKWKITVMINAMATDVMFWGTKQGAADPV